MHLQSGTGSRLDIAKYHSSRYALVTWVLTLAIACLFVFGNPAAARAQSDEPSKPASEKSDPAAKAGEKKEIENPFPDRPKVPSGIFDGGKGWLNTSGPISVKDLKGKVVLVDFWTYCCINCMHVLPDLKYLEKKYPNELVVIGVHSAKFENEKDSENIRRAVQRYEIEHPVVNDSEMTIWRSFGVNAWPTLVLLDPEGHYLGSISGEGHREVLEAIIKKLIAYHKAKGTLDETPVEFALESEKLKPTPLRFPSKVLADEKSSRLFIADTNHNRIVVTSFDGKLQQIIGSGLRGNKDGSYDAAEFDHPHGMALVDGVLYIADTENHLIRTVDLQTKTVSTLAGTGVQARRRPPGGKLKEVALNSPWALVEVDGTLFVTMAGPHQIWSHKLGSDRIAVFSGSGREDIVDGSHAEAALAQPSGIVTDGESLFFVDSEGSSIRRADTKADGGVTTIIGPSDLPFGRLFEFGDVDDVGTKARLQHPIGIAISNKTLFVADSYNHKIKRVDKTDAGWKTSSLLGTGKRGNEIDPVQFSEPEGISAAGGKLFIADTNNHRICVADLQTSKVVALAITGLKPPARTERPPAETRSKKKPLKIAAQTVAPGKTLDFEIELKLPKEYKLNKLAPVFYKVKAVGDQQLLAKEELNARKVASAEGTTATVKLPLSAKTGGATLELALTFSYCRDGVGGLCKLKTVRWEIPVKLAAAAKQKMVKLVADATK